MGTGAPISAAEEQAVCGVRFQRRRSAEEICSDGILPVCRSKSPPKSNAPAGLAGHKKDAHINLEV